MSDEMPEALVACHECDLLHRREPLPPGARADCDRCGALLYRHVPNGNDHALAWALTAGVLLIIANSFPFLGMKIGGLVEQNRLWSGARALYELGMGELGLLVFLTSVVFPFVLVAAMLYLLIPARFGRMPPGMGPVFRVLRALEPWAMVGVFLLGAFIAIVKLQDMATVLPGIALYAFAAALIALSAARASFDAERLWARSAQRSPTADELAPGERLLNCHACGLLVRPAHGHEACPRCGAGLHHRKENSIARTWALVLSAAILMVPAQIYPVMTVRQLGSGEPSTILSGVQQLVHHGLYGLAAIVFIASLVVPIAKLIVLVVLLRTVQSRSAWRPRDRTLLYRITEVVGAWSMVDVFLVGLLSGLVSLDLLASIEPGIGASFFGAVVVLTMFAAHSFDPRLIWDHAVDDAAPAAHADARGASA
ncbi:MAG TPA: paraquat-inducible protein A [Pseudomonadales bacterium]|nr:paraquat-inducible protein A [Pseudomonadales bacterium]